MPSLIHAAQRGSYEDFLQVYRPADAEYRVAGGATLLFKSVANTDIAARVAITTRLLDDGADPAVASGDLNVLHVLFGRPGHDAELEAPMLRRLIEGGADVNLVSNRFGPPLIGLIENGPLPESERVPFYDVFFESPHLDLTVPAMRAKATLKDFILANSGLPLLRQRVTAFEESRDAAH